MEIQLKVTHTVMWLQLHTSNAFKTELVFVNVILKMLKNQTFSLALFSILKPFNYNVNLAISFFLNQHAWIV